MKKKRRMLLIIIIAVFRKRSIDRIDLFSLNDFTGFVFLLVFQQLPVTLIATLKMVLELTYEICSMSVLLIFPNYLIFPFFFAIFKKNSSGFNDFAVRRIKHAPYGRREIEIAEEGSSIE